MPRVNNARLLSFLNIIIFIVNGVLVVQICQLSRVYESKTKSLIYEQTRHGVQYKVRGGNEPAGILYTGDLVGNHPRLAQYLADHFPFEATAQFMVAVIRFDNMAAHRGGQGGLDRIANEKGIVPADNFCVENWEKVKAKPRYQSTSFSPGPFCFSEPQSVFMHNLIQQHHITEAKILYDSEAYLTYLDTFLKYLRENNISYSLVQFDMTQ